MIGPATLPPDGHIRRQPQHKAQDFPYQEGNYGVQVMRIDQPIGK
jgi:hypothetical protein